MNWTDHTTPLRRVRKARTLSQETLASLLKITQVQLSRAERGETTLSADVQELAATILGVPRAELFPEPVTHESV